MRLASVTASSLRGIPKDWPSIEFGDKGLVVYGANGVGKSSFVDAIEWVLTGESSLFSSNRWGVNWQNAAPNVKGDGSYSIVAQVKPLSGANIELHSNSEVPQNLRAWIEKAKASRFVLRRHMLLRFVDATPQARYQQVEPFLALGNFALIEARLSSQARALESTQVSANHQLQAMDTSLRRQFQLALDVPLTPKLFLDGINLSLSAAHISLCRSLRDEDLENCISSLDQDPPDSTRQDRVAKFGHLKVQLQRLQKLSDFSPLIEQLQKALQDYELLVRGQEARDITGYLSESKNLLDTLHPAHCLVCEQPIESEKVSLRLEERLLAQEQLVSAASHAASCRKALERPLEIFVRELASICNEWPGLLAIPLPISYDAARRLAEELVQFVQSNPLVAEQLAPYKERIELAVVSYDDAIAAIDTQLDQGAENGRRAIIAELRLKIETLRRDWPAYVWAKSRAITLERQRLVYVRFLDHAIEARKDAVKQILSEVEAIANSYYEFLHPREHLSSTKLVVRPTEDGSLNLQATFFGNSEQPLLHYSESHLDTLGLCYFLALRRRDAARDPDFKLLVLDDVLHSVDAAHRMRIAQLLKNEFNDHQIFLVTHDRFFYDRLRSTLGLSGFRYLALTDWSIEAGPVRGDPSTDLDRIVSQEQRASKSTEELSAAGGRLFEWLSKVLAENLEVAIAARFERGHDLGSLWPPLSKKLRGQKPLLACHPNVVTDLDDNLWVRNAVGAHNNETAVAVDPSEVRNFAQALANLYSATHCESCGSFIRKQKDGNWKCDCAALSYS